MSTPSTPAASRVAGALPAARERLRRSGDIRSVLRGGVSAHGRAAAVHARPGPTRDGPARSAVVAGAKVGGAVQRNRAKRRLRAVLEATTLPPGVDVVVLARRASLEAPSAELAREVAELVGAAARRARGAS